MTLSRHCRRVLHRSRIKARRGIGRGIPCRERGVDVARVGPVCCRVRHDAGIEDACEDDWRNVIRRTRRRRTRGSSQPKSYAVPPCPLQLLVPRERHATCACRVLAAGRVLPGVNVGVRALCRVLCCLGRMMTPRRQVSPLNQFASRLVPANALSFGVSTEHGGNRGRRGLFSGHAHEGEDYSAQVGRIRVGSLQLT